MTMHTRYSLTCSCGHSGSVKVTENDQPYSSMYESYSLEGFTGDTYSVDGYSSLKTAIERMKPVCPKCSSQLSEKNLDVS